MVEFSDPKAALPAWVRLLNKGNLSQRAAFAFIATANSCRTLGCTDFPSSSIAMFLDGSCSKHIATVVSHEFVRTFLLPKTSSTTMNVLLKGLSCALMQAS